MDVVLIAGLWLPESIWAEVSVELSALGHRPMPVSLPGVDDGSTSATLAQQLDAALAVVDAADDPVVVGHSAACTLAWMVADRRPDTVARLIFVGGFPAGAGEKYADFFPVVNDGVPFPGWEAFAGPDSDDLNTAQKEMIGSLAVPVPADVAGGEVTLTDDRRYEIPLVMVCPEYSAEQAKTWVDGGEVPELVRARSVEYVDIESGHWPMVSQPVGFARTLDHVIRSDS